jgi:hypothetical protein
LLHLLVERIPVDHLEHGFDKRAELLVERGSEDDHLGIFHDLPREILNKQLLEHLSFEKHMPGLPNPKLHTT